MFFLAHARFESQNKNYQVLSYSLIYELFYSLSVRLLTYLQQAFLAIVKLKRSLRSGLLQLVLLFFLVLKGSKNK